MEHLKGVRVYLPTASILRGGLSPQGLPSPAHKLNPAPHILTQVTGSRCHVWLQRSQEIYHRIKHNLRSWSFPAPSHTWVNTHTITSAQHNISFTAVHQILSAFWALFSSYIEHTYNSCAVYTWLVFIHTLSNSLVTFITWASEHLTETPYSSWKWYLFPLGKWMHVGFFLPTDICTYTQVVHRVFTVTCKQAYFLIMEEIFWSFWSPHYLWHISPGENPLPLHF